MHQVYVIDFLPLVIIAGLIATATWVLAGPISQLFSTPSYSEPNPPSLDDIAAHEARLRAETRKLHAQAQHDEALIQAETARTSLENIREIIKSERRR